MSGNIIDVTYSLDVPKYDHNSKKNSSDSSQTGEPNHIVIEEVKGRKRGRKSKPYIF